ncbi:MAG TPA: hypothetical protein V6D19_12945 [Stenomitos sp.]
MKRFLTTILTALLVLGSVSPAYAEFNITGGGTYKLNSSIGISNTTINLSSFKEPVSLTPYTMAYLNTDIAYGTLDPQNESRSEFISFTGITQNSNGTAVLTGVTRGLTRTPTPGATGCTASSTLRQAHTGQSAFILSDNPCLFTQYSVKQNDETVTGSWTFPTPTAGGNPATKEYVDEVVGGVTTNDKVSVAGTAGETFSAGELVYLKTSDARWYEVDNDISSTVLDTIIGIAQGSGTAGNNISGGILLLGLDSNQTGLTAGANYFASTTAGSIGTATTTRIAGKARTTTSLYFNPFMPVQTFATSSLRVGAFPAYEIGKNEFFSTSTGSGTFTKPAGINKIWFEMVGGGGGGSGASASAADSGRGGGGGGYCTGIIDVSSVSSIAYTIGTAGAGGAIGSGGTNGATSTLSTFCTAAGGKSNSGGGVGGTATTSSATVTTISGQNGSYNIDSGSTGISGGGGDSAIGLGGAFVADGTTNINGNPGTGFGAGGGSGIGSASTGAVGGAGTAGLLRIRW